MTDQPTTTKTPEELRADHQETSRQLSACWEMFRQHPVPERWALLRDWALRHQGTYAAYVPEGTRTVCLDYCPCRPAFKTDDLRACCNCGSQLPHKEAPARCVNCGTDFHTWAQCAYRADDFRPAPGPMHVKPCPCNWPEEISGALHGHDVGYDGSRWDD